VKGHADLILYYYAVTARGGSFIWRTIMETRVAIVGIIVEDPEAVSALNSLLHEYREFVVGRMGIPYSKKKVNVISVVIDAPQDTIAALSGKIGNIRGISAKTVYSKV
jgi:putative iron-only hydrogenase system regulator